MNLHARREVVVTKQTQKYNTESHIDESVKVGNVDCGEFPGLI